LTTSAVSLCLGAAADRLPVAEAFQQQPPTLLVWGANDPIFT